MAFALAQKSVIDDHNCDLLSGAGIAVGVGLQLIEQAGRCAIGGRSQAEGIQQDCQQCQYGS